MTAPSKREKAGFTILEMMVVIVILAALAAIVVPASQEVTRESNQAAFASELRIFVDAAVLYEAKYEAYLEDSSSGDVPAGLEEFISVQGWEDGTPIGGVWDVELDSFGVVSALGVHFQGGGVPDALYMSEIDALIDNGDLRTGGFRELAADRFYYVLADD